MSAKEFQILLIDDDEDDYVNLRALFEETPNNAYRLTWKSSYQKGIVALREQEFDACLLDYRLGERTGLDLLREVQGRGGGTGTGKSKTRICPIIFLTGHGDLDLDLQAMQIGAAEFLVKDQLTAPLLERSIRYSIKHALDMQEVEEQRESFKTLFNSTFEGIIVHSQGRIRDVNQGASSIFSRTREEMIEHSFLELVRGDHRSHVKEILASDVHQKIEAIGLRRDGSEAFIELSNRPVHLLGQNLSLVVIRDLTDRKQMEGQILQQDRLASLGLLASSLAHEIGTPLGIIRSRAEMAERKLGDNKPLKQDMEIVISQIDKIAKLVNSLLHLARSKQSELASPVDLNQVIQDVLNLVRHELDRKGIVLETQVQGNFFVLAEAGPLGQVLLNLMVNAVHAIEEALKNGRREGHRVILRVASHPHNAETVQIFVQDTGCGIPEKNHSQLFKPFFTTKDIGHGTGLGLATSYKLVQSWGGSISVDSKGPGALFSVNLVRCSTPDSAGSGALG